MRLTDIYHHFSSNILRSFLYMQHGQLVGLLSFLSTFLPSSPLMEWGQFNSSIVHLRACVRACVCVCACVSLGGVVFAETQSRIF